MMNLDNTCMQVPNKVWKWGFDVSLIYFCTYYEHAPPKSETTATHINIYNVICLTLPLMRKELWYKIFNNLNVLNVYSKNHDLVKSKFKKKIAAILEPMTGQWLSNSEGLLHNKYDVVWYVICFCFDFLCFFVVPSHQCCDNVLTFSTHSLLYKLHSSEERYILQK